MGKRAAGGRARNVCPRLCVHVAVAVGTSIEGRPLNVIHMEQ